MSRKSRQPEAAGKGKKGKGRKGKKGAPEQGQRRLVVDSQPSGVPFPVVVLIAAVMTLPSLSNYLSGGLRFDALMVRVFAALAVAWLLSSLVFAVFESMRSTQVSAVVELPPEEAFEVVAQRGALSGTIVGDEYGEEPDPFALDPIEPLPLADPGVGEVESERGEPAA